MSKHNVNGNLHKLGSRKSKIFAVLFASMLVISALLVGTYSVADNFASASPAPLNVEICGPVDTHLGVGEWASFTANVSDLNRYSLFWGALEWSDEATYSWGVTPEDNKTELVCDGAGVEFRFVEATEEPYVLYVNVSAYGRVGHQWVTVYDPFTQPSIYSDGYPGMGRTVQCDGLGWYRFIDVNGRARSASTDVNATFNAAIRSGGQVWVQSGDYSGAVLSVPGNCSLTAEAGVSGIVYASIGDGARIDEPTFNSQFGGYRGGEFCVASNGSVALAFKSDGSIFFFGGDNGAVEAAVYASGVVGQVVLAGVRHSYVNSVPVGVFVVEHFGGAVRSFVNVADSRGSPYIISVDSVEEGYYLAQDSQLSIIDGWTSTDCGITANNVTDALHTKVGGGLIVFGVGSFYFNTPWVFKDFRYTPNGITTLSGEGCGIQIMGAGMTSTYLLANSSMQSLISITDSDFFTISKLTLIGNNNVDYNLEINTNPTIWCGHITLEKMTFESSNVAAIYGNASDIRVFDDSFGHANQWHILNYGPSLRVDKGNTFGWCGMSGSGGGIYVAAISGGQAQILNSYFEMFQTVAIQIGDSDDNNNFANGNIIAGNIFLGLTQYPQSRAIHGVNTAFTQIENNQFYNVANPITMTYLSNANGYNIITGNTIHQSAIPTSNGNLCAINSTGSSHSTITDNTIYGNGNSSTYAIYLYSSGYASITGNDIYKFGTAFYQRYSFGAGYSTFSSNTLTSITNGIFEVDNYCGNNIYSSNIFRSVATPITLASASNSSIIDNWGYNPKGYIATPFVANLRYISDSGSNATISSDRVYTNQGSPKDIYITGGTVTAITVNGEAVGVTSGLITLAPRDTFSITFSEAPTLKVYAK